MPHLDVIVTKFKNTGYFIIFTLLLLWIWSSSLYLNITKISFSSEISYKRNETEAGQKSKGTTTDIIDQRTVILSEILALNQTKESLTSDIRHLTFISNLLKSQVDRANLTLAELQRNANESLKIEKEINITLAELKRNANESLKNGNKRKNGSIEIISSPSTPIQLSSNSLTKQNQSCQIPDFGEIEEDLKSNFAFHEVTGLNCESVQQELTTLADGKLHWNISLLRSLQKDEWEELVSNRYSDKKETECFGRLISRDTDFAVQYSPKFAVHPLDGPVKVNSSFISVSCYNRGDILYSNVHVNIVQVERKVSRKVPSVLLIMVESLSRVNAHHQLPQTVEILRQLYNATIFTGVTKVGDNTFPNLVALLTGLDVGPRDGSYTKEVEPFLKGDADTHDNLPFVWNNYSSIGCATFYSEDAPHIGAFNYQKKGFSKPPTDYYDRTFFLAAEHDSMLKRSKEGCVGRKPNFWHQREHVKQFLQTHQDRCSFSLVFHAQVGHDKDMNKVSVLDKDLSSWLRDNKGLLQDSVVIVAGDHGNRFPNIKESLGRRVEERMPFMALILPSSFVKKYPHLQTNLENNKDRLISHFDIHKTLVDLSNMGSSNQSEASIITQDAGGRTPLSLLTPIPLSRSCPEAGVPAPYCLCNKETDLAANDTKAIEAAQAVVKKLNKLLDKYTMVCNEQEVGEILRSQLVDGLGVRVAVRTLTGERIEALVGDGGVLGDIHRLDYGGIKEWCVPIDYIQLFCNCK